MGCGRSGSSLYEEDVDWEKRMAEIEQHREKDRQRLLEIQRKDEEYKQLVQDVKEIKQLLKQFKGDQ
jgi:hypothetical protein